MLVSLSLSRTSRISLAACLGTSVVLGCGDKSGADGDSLESSTSITATATISGGDGDTDSMGETGDGSIPYSTITSTRSSSINPITRSRTVSTVSPGRIRKLITASARVGRILDLELPDAIVAARRDKRSEGGAFRLGYRLYRMLFRLFTGQQLPFGNFCLIPAAAVKRVVYQESIWNHLAAR